MFTCSIAAIIFLSKFLNKKIESSSNLIKKDYLDFKAEEERYKSYLSSEFRIKRVEYKEKEYQTCYVPQILRRDGWRGIKGSSTGDYSVWLSEDGSASLTELGALELIQKFKEYVQKQLDELPQNIKNFDKLYKLKQKYDAERKSQLEANRPNVTYINVE